MKKRLSLARCASGGPSSRLCGRRLHSRRTCVLSEACPPRALSDTDRDRGPVAGCAARGASLCSGGGGGEGQSAPTHQTFRGEGRHCLHGSPVPSGAVWSGSPPESDGLALGARPLSCCLGGRTPTPPQPQPLPAGGPALAGVCLWGDWAGLPGVLAETPGGGGGSARAEALRQREEALQDLSAELRTNRCQLQAQPVRPRWATPGWLPDLSVLHALR